MMLKLELARRVFWEYCKLLAPDFYTDDRYHLRILCDTLQSIYDGTLLKADGSAYRKLMINMPPQHGKSRTLIYFSDWMLGRNTEERIITASYNDDAAGDFSKYTRDGITEEKNTPDQIVYSDIFPNTKLKFGSKSYSKWALEGQHFNYLGAGVGGSITGKGGSVLIVDDPIKSAEIALNEDALEKIWTWYTGTFLSRVSAKDGDPIEIFNMTRWSKKDPCGRILDGPDKNEWFVLKFKAYDEETGRMLCPSLLSKKRYDTLKSLMVPEIFLANYNQEPIDVKGRLYPAFKTYIDIPRDVNGNSLFTKIANYTDTADEGEDFLCSICYGVYNKEAYVIDIIYTKDPMEITEPAVAKMLLENKVRDADIESNSGGRGFARAVQKYLKEKYNSILCTVRWFHQSQNKQARILTNSTLVQQHIYYPVNWADRWPLYFQAMVSYQKEGKNTHDDGPDATTGVAERAGIKTNFEFGG
jgi:predicted phage terminase large subunit-like protein